MSESFGNRVWELKFWRRKSLPNWAEGLALLCPDGICAQVVSGAAMDSVYHGQKKSVFNSHMGWWDRLDSEEPQTHDQSSL